MKVQMIFTFEVDTYEQADKIANGLNESLNSLDMEFGFDMAFPRGDIT